GRRDHRDLYSHPTRRSSDLTVGAAGEGFFAALDGGRVIVGAERLLGRPTVERDRAQRLAALLEVLGQGDRLGLTRSLEPLGGEADRKSTRLNSSHVKISYAV